MAGFGLLTLGIVGIIVAFIVIWIISSLSVYIAARIIGVQVPFLRTLFVTLIADIISFIINIVTVSYFLSTFNFAVLIIGLIISFVITLAIYKYLFDIDWIKTFIMLIIAGVIYFGIMVILGLILTALGFLVFGGIFSSLQAVH
ncbi:putative membrane protein [Candidatus Nanobsidianus stetteri]|uniref:Putative membrane protein n=1 Tax=Nanobsidianus stetteri TaxID=1294122 RepID=R1E547_NANST|nr:putative membrane protein [Candidatus Nanobsidianus stetteri]